MATSNLEQIAENIASEIQVNASGYGVATIAGTARLCGISHQNLSKACNSLTSKLTQTLMQHGFKPATFAESGVPDIAVALTVSYYANKAGVRCTEVARQANDVFLAIGVRAWMQDITGWKSPQRSESAIDPVLAMLEVIQQTRLAQIQHEERLSSIEVQNSLLVEENQVLKSHVRLLQSSQEAIELETEANAAELDRYRNGHGRFYTVSAWCNLNGYTMSLQECNLQGRKATAMCRTLNIIPQPVSDPRFGTVGSYPDSVLEELNWQNNS